MSFSPPSQAPSSLPSRLKSIQLNCASRRPGSIISLRMSAEDCRPAGKSAIKSAGEGRRRRQRRGKSGSSKRTRRARRRNSSRRRPVGGGGPRRRRDPDGAVRGDGARRHDRAEQAWALATRKRPVRVSRCHSPGSFSPAGAVVASCAIATGAVRIAAATRTPPRPDRPRPRTESRRRARRVLFDDPLFLRCRRRRPPGTLYRPFSAGHASADIRKEIIKPGHREAQFNWMDFNLDGKDDGACEGGLNDIHYDRACQHPSDDFGLHYFWSRCRPGLGLACAQHSVAWPDRHGDRQGRACRQRDSNPGIGRRPRSGATATTNCLILSPPCISRPSRRLSRIRRRPPWRSFMKALRPLRSSRSGLSPFQYPRAARRPDPTLR